mgnify:CR=1 FL=1
MKAKQKQRFVYPFFELLKLHLLFCSHLVFIVFIMNVIKDRAGLCVAVIFGVPFNILNANHMLHETRRMCNITFHHGIWSDNAVNGIGCIDADLLRLGGVQRGPFLRLRQPTTRRMTVGYGCISMWQASVNCNTNYQTRRMWNYEARIQLITVN